MARAVALLRDHPLTPLLVVYAAINILAGVFEFGPSKRPHQPGLTASPRDLLLSLAWSDLARIDRHCRVAVLASHINKDASHLESDQREPKRG